MFQIGHVYRRVDLHREHGGQRQGGISTPRGFPGVFLFTGESGEQYGYRDGWAGEVFLYTGEGQRGDMAFVRGNRAIRDHMQAGKDLYLFAIEQAGCRYLGSFDCAGWALERSPDVDATERSVIVFELVLLEGSSSEKPVMPTAGIPLEALRRRALAASVPVVTPRPGVSVQSFRARSREVAEYVLARADGRCEACERPSPFRRPDKTPYLETHHVRRLSDGGPDHPRWVAAVCPNCHRQAHHGEDRDDLNRELATRLTGLEESAAI